MKRARRPGSWLLGLAYGLAACSSRPAPPDGGNGADVHVLDASDAAPLLDAARDGSNIDAAMDALGDAALDGAGGDAAGDSAMTDADGSTQVDVITVSDGGDANDDTFAPDDAVDVLQEDIVIPSSCEQDASAMPLCNSDSECIAVMERCLPTGCAVGERRCQRAGRACVDDTDCLAGAQSCVEGTCVAIGADCGDTRACPLGFLCEGTAGARSCVDRRRACGTIDNLCPYNAICYQTAGSGAFCVAVATHCHNDAACLPGTRCRDLDGDGQSECAPAGPCGPGTCGDAGAQNCEVLPVEFVPVCGVHGLCSASAPCATGYSCVDAWGTGVGECHLDADACHSHADCASGSLCYTADEEGQDGGASGCR